MNCIQQQEKCMPRFVLFVATMVALLLAGSTSALAQCTDSWTGAGGDNNWTNGANWSTGNEPGSSDNACITTSGAAVVLDVADGIADLTVGSSDSLTFPTVTNTNNGLNVNGSSIANSGQIILAVPVQFGTTSLEFSSSGKVTLSGRGTITLNANSFGGDSIGGSATLVNKSTIQGGGGFDMTFNNASAGVINANESGVQLVVGRNQAQGASTNTGLMEGTNGGQLVMGSLTLNNVGGTVKASGKNSYVLLEGEGQGGETFTGGTWTTANGGVIQVIDGTVLLDGTNGNTITNSGTMQLVDGASHPGGNFQGTINNTGTIQVLSRGNQVGLNIPSGQTFTLMGSGNLTLGDGTSNPYNNQTGISGGGSFVNQQLVQGSGYILNLNSFNNSGTINANVPTGSNSLQLQLGRAGASTNTGTIEATNGGGMLIGSTTINNVGGTIAASGANSYVALVGSLGTSGLTITGGTLDGSGGGVVYGQGGSLLDGTTNTVNNTGAMVINYQDLQAQGTLNNTGTIQILAPTDDNGQVFLQIPNGENLTITGKGSIIMGDGTDNSYNNNAAIGNNFGTNGIFTNNSTVTGTGQIGLTGGVTNNGVMNANVPVGNSGLELFLSRIGGGVFLNNGIIEATHGGKFGFDPGFGLGGNFTNTGTLMVAANSTIDLTNGDFTNLASGTLTGGTYNVTGTLYIVGNITTNDAKIALTGKASQILNPNTDALAGFLTNASKGGFGLKGGRSFTSAGTFTNQGEISISKGSTFTVGMGGSYFQHGGKTTVNGKLALSSTEGRTQDSASDSDPAAAIVRIEKGSLFGNGGTVAAHLSSSGTVIPADSMTAVGNLKVTGAYTQTAVGALDANIAGANAGQFNVLNVSGTATLGGTLNIGLLNNFVPVIGAEFEILTAKHVTGTFVTVNGAKINSSEHFTVTYNSDNVTLTVVSGE
jgi:fibronectin-binding autotransporter adhesin